MTLALFKPKLKVDYLEDRLKDTATQNACPNQIKNSKRGEVIAVTYGKKPDNAQLAKRIKALNQADIVLLQDEKDYKSYEKQQKRNKATKTVVAIKPSKWPNWGKINQNFLNPKKDSLFVVDTAMDVLYCADREIKISSKGKIKKEYKSISFF